ncbi:putative mitochondrial protein [Sesamum angolense]|uniref:Mitochondrial protein n=1 Tax=Sesamum angolense TaxID=2727404 RepID=A0AAE1T9Y8_9LAMI|nr:putative mitochondrial protein [Sesamum angolense]
MRRETGGDHRNYGEPDNGTHTVSERLDRACASESWSCLFPDTRVHHVGSPYSDHSPLVIELQPRAQWDLSGGRKCFRFEAAWLQEPACADIVKKTWLAPQTSRTECRFREKLSMVSARLSCWGRLYGRETRDRIKELERLLVARKQSRMTQDNRDQMSSDKAELSKLILQEETFWKQRSKDLWLKEGDRNSSFFHAKASRRHQTNSIRKLRNPDGSWTETAEGVQRCILEYFQGVFTSSRPRPDDIQSGTEFLPTVVNAEMVEDLLRPYTETEVTKALFGMSPLKSPGPDGMPPIFYQKFWHVVKSDVISCVLNFLNSRILPRGFNETHIVLIPKCKQPQSLSQYRPISLCNVAYKIASKSIANRLKPWLDRIISPAQSAFVPGRLITDNVLLAFETNHFLNTHSRGRKHFMNLKLDISKAYDRVEWSFLKRVLANVPTVHAICQILNVYKLASGQEINLHKSSAVFSRNTPLDIQRDLAQALGLRLENKHELYLGLPAVAFRSKRALFAALKDRIWNRIQGWHEKTLSQAGKAVLIQAVVQAIPTYAMSCFKLPRTLLQEFQALAANFFWHDGDRRRIHWLAWDKMCKSKLQGGLGFRNLEAFNLALLAKQLWRLLSRPESLVCRVLKAKFPLTHLFDAQLGARPSFTWRSIMAAMQLFRSGCRWRIGTGHSVNIGTDPWLPRSPSFRVITPRPSHVHVVWVHDLISEDLHDWNVELIRAMFWPEDRDLILQTPLSLVGSVDLLVWHYSKNGIFSVRSAYHLALSMSVKASSSGTGWPLQLWHKVWQAPAPNKVKLFIWRAIRNILPTASNLQRRIPYDNFSCPLCESVSEGPIHTFFHCAFARQVWALSNVRWHILDSSPLSMEEWITDLSAKLSSTEFAFVTMVCWTIWWTRNLKLANKEFLLPLQLGYLFVWTEVAMRKWLRHWQHGKQSILLSDTDGLGPLVADIRFLSSRIDHVSFSFVRRLGNSAADS